MTVSTTSPAAATHGAQRPRTYTVPEAVSSSGREAAELARLAGLGLDPWQELVLDAGLSERADGRWAAFEVGLCVSRQNGKGGVLEARELAGLFLLGERLIVHSAHQFDTSLEAFRRLLALIEETPELDRRIKRVSRAHGDEGIELLSGQRIRFRTRTKGGGRGFTGDLLVLDEAMYLADAAHGALLPTLSARPNPQVWYTGSAVDETVHEDGRVFARVRERGLAGDDTRLAYFEWSADAALGDAERVAEDREAWAAANPALGIRINPEFVEQERRTLDPRTFAVERLGIGAWPDLHEDASHVIAPDAWRALTDPASTPVDPVFFAIDTTPDRSRSAIAVAGRREDGLSHVEIVEHRAGTSWVPPRVAELVERHGARPVRCDSAGPAASLVPELRVLGLEVALVAARELAQACGRLHGEVLDRRVRHLGTVELAAAIKGARRRQLGDAWAWSRRDSSVDISPLVAVTLALWGLVDEQEPVMPGIYWPED